MLYVEFSEKLPKSSLMHNFLEGIILHLDGSSMSMMNLVDFLGDN